MKPATSLNLLYDMTGSHLEAATQYDLGLYLHYNYSDDNLRIPEMCLHTRSDDTADN